MTGIIIIQESSIMLCRSLEWSMKWKQGPEQVLQAFGPLLLLHPLSESRDALDTQPRFSPPLSEGHQSQPL